MGKKCDFWLLVCDGLVWVFQKQLINWDSDTQPENEKIPSEWQFCGRNCLVNARSQRRMARLVQADRKATVTQISTRYN